MKRHEIAGVEINAVSIHELLFSKTMLLAYLLLALGAYGVWEVFSERYFLLTANAFDAGMHPGSTEVAEAMKEAVFGVGGEVKREQPWTLYIVNYMYMIYTGSAIIFFVALAEIFNVKLIQRTAAGFITFGLAMIFGGLFTIAVDLNILHMHWMFITPNIRAGMWLMLPLYVVYIPFVLFEIYLLITNKHDWAKKVAFGILLLSIAIDLVEYYIQAKLFNMNTARHFWTTYPILPLYFIVSSFLAASGMMILYAFVEYGEKFKYELARLILFLKKAAVVSMLGLAAYEASAFLFIDKEVADVILFGGYKYIFYIYIVLAVALPFVLLAYKIIKEETHYIMTGIAAVSIVIGTYVGRYIFVYGGNAYPMSNRYGLGFEKYGEYEQAKEFIIYTPHLNEILVVIGSVGVVLAVYKVMDMLFSVSKIRDH